MGKAKKKALEGEVIQGSQVIDRGGGKVILPTLLETGNIHPNEWNPNEEDDSVFAELLDEIDKKGFLKPIKVCPHPEKAGAWLIIDGEHRWRAARSLGITEIPCHIDLTLKTRADQQIDTLRQNNLRGQQNEEKAAAIFQSVSAKGEAQRALLAQKALVADRDVERWQALHDQKEGQVGQAQKALEEANKKKQQVARQMAKETSELMQEMLEGEDAEAAAENNFLMFSHKGKQHMAVKSTPALFRELQEMEKLLLMYDMNSNEFLSEAIRNHRKVVEERMEDE